MTGPTPDAVLATVVHAAQAPGADRLLELLPAVHRSRDEQLGHPLRALLRVIEEQVDLVAADLDNWYDNWFVETCDDLVLAQLGRLVAQSGVTSMPPGLAPQRARLLAGALSPRRAVADAVTDRRTKGTAAGLEAVALDAAGWPARAVELYARLVRDQHLRHLRLDRKATLDVRDALACERLDGPFDDAPHSPDVRRIDSEQTRGLHNLPSLALFVWRLRSFGVSRAPAFCIDQRNNHYLVDVLGIDRQLFSRQPAGPLPSHLAEPADVPHPIGRIDLEAARRDYYGPGLSLMIWRDKDRRPVPVEQVVAADLSDWAYRPTGSQVAVDPVLGRIAFSSEDAPEDGVWVSWHYGFSAAIGGGEYRRPISTLRGRQRYVVAADTEVGSISAALGAWAADKAAAPDDKSLHDVVVEIADSADYTEAVRIDLDPGDHLEVRAGPGRRPVIRLLNQRANRFDALMVRATTTSAPTGSVSDCPPPSASRPTLVLDGLMVVGRSLDVGGQVGEVVLRHCTLVPGWTLDSQCRPQSGEEPSVELRNTTARLRVEHSIIGTIAVDADEVAIEPLEVDLCDSVVDSTSGDLAAITGPDDRSAYIVLTMRRCTVFGEVLIHLARLVEDSLLTECLHSACPADACIRHGAIEVGTRGIFTSTRYGRPGYAQLAQTCPTSISAGAQDGAELGVFHDLFNPQRLANITDRLTEYVPIGIDPAVVPVT